MISPISYAELQRGILLRRENPTCRYWAAATRGSIMVLFTASRRNNFVGGTCALPSALLVTIVFISLFYGQINDDGGGGVGDDNDDGDDDNDNDISHYLSNTYSSHRTQRMYDCLQSNEGKFS